MLLAHQSIAYSHGLIVFHSFWLDCKLSIQGIPEGSFTAAGQSTDYHDASEIALKNVWAK